MRLGCDTVNPLLRKSPTLPSGLGNQPATPAAKGSGLSPRTGRSSVFPWRYVFCGCCVTGHAPAFGSHLNAHRPGPGSPAISIVIIAGRPPTRPSRVRSADLRPPLTAALCMRRSPLCDQRAGRRRTASRFVRWSMRSVRSYGWACRNHADPLEYDTNTATNSSSTDPIRPPSAGGFAAASACEGRQVAARSSPLHGSPI